jgi:hypothetical protein
MALTVSNKITTIFGNQRVTMAKVTFDNSYPTGGEPITPADFDLSIINHVLVNAATGGARLFDWLRSGATDTLRVFTALGTQATNGSDQSAQSVNVMVVGK